MQIKVVYFVALFALAGVVNDSFCVRCYAARKLYRPEYKYSPIADYTYCYERNESADDACDRKHGGEWFCSPESYGDCRPTCAAMLIYDGVLQQKKELLKAQGKEVSKDLDVQPWSRNSFVFNPHTSQSSPLTGRSHIYQGDIKVGGGLIGHMCEQLNKLNIEYFGQDHDWNKEKSCGDTTCMDWCQSVGCDNWQFVKPISDKINDEQSRLVSERVSTFD